MAPSRAVAPDTNVSAPRRLGGAREAAAIAGVDTSTVYNWLRQGLISGVRVGRGRIKYDLDEVAATIVEYPRPDVDALKQYLQELRSSGTRSSSRSENRR